MSSLRNNSKFQSPAKGVSPAKNASTSKSTAFGVSARSSKGMQSSNEFSRQIKNAQNQAGEDIEDEYIKNLQQQIAYMELELKLLKEKELEQKQSVSQIDKFFNDGVPLNENILALKNQYQHNKKNFENRIDELNELRMEEIKQAADLKNNYERSGAALKTIIEALDKKEKEYTAQMIQARMAFLNERNRRVQAEKDFRLLQFNIKKTNDENLKMTRDLERESVLVHHKDEMLKSKRQKTKDDLKAKEEWIVSLSRDVEKKRTAATFNPEVTMLENENLDLSAKVIRCEKEANIARAKVKEMEMFLESKKRERILEAQQKRDLMARISVIKFQIDEQNKMNEIEIKKKVEDKEEKEKKDLNKEIEEVKTGKTIFKQRMQEKEDIIRDMAQEKMGVQQDILALEQETQALDKEFKEKAEVLIQLKNNSEALTQEERELTEKLEPVEKDVEKLRKLIPSIEKHNEELRDRIAHEEKKNELSMQIKNVNLEELMLLVQSNDQVQNTISDLMRKWDFLQRLNLGDA